MNNNAGQTAVLAQNLSKVFGKFTAVDRISFEVNKGEIFGFLGPNGAGKTTTIKILCGLLNPTSGQARVLDWDVAEQPEDIKQHIGYMSQKFSLYEELTVEQNLDFFGGIYGLHGDRKRSRDQWVLEMAGLTGKRNMITRDLPLGWKQRLALGCALLHEPPVIFLDEPTSGVDPEVRRKFWLDIYDLKKQGKTILVSTHNLDEADRLCDRIAVLKTHLLALDTPAALRHQFYGRTVVFHLGQAEPRFAQAIGKNDFVQKTQIIDNKIVVTLDDPETHNPTIVRTLVESGAEIQFVGELRHTLEDVYLRLVRNEDRNEKVQNV